MLVTVAGEKKEIEQGTTIAKLIVDEKVENPDYVTDTVTDDGQVAGDLCEGDDIHCVSFLTYLATL